MELEKNSDFMPTLVAYGENQREDRVLSLLSSRPNWDSPNPSHAGECVVCTPPPPSGWGGGGGVSLACGRGGEEAQFQRGDRHCGTLGI
jgi:hypothetical protein